MTGRQGTMEWPGMTGRRAGRPAARRAERGAERGFTLVELLVVLAILGLLVGIAAPMVMKQLSGARTRTAGIEIERLSGVLDLYRLELGDYPAAEDGLKALVERPAGAERWNGPYVTKADAILDPWDRPYRYRYPGEHGRFDIYSLGHDGQDGGDGEDRDVTSW